MTIIITQTTTTVSFDTHSEFKKSYEYIFYMTILHFIIGFNYILLYGYLDVLYILYPALQPYNYI